MLTKFQVFLFNVMHYFEHFLLCVSDLFLDTFNHIGFLPLGRDCDHIKILHIISSLS